MNRGGRERNDNEQNRAAQFNEHIIFYTSAATAYTHALGNRRGATCTVERPFG